MILRIICLIATTIGIVCVFNNIGIILIIAFLLNLVLLIKDTINKEYDSWYLMLIAFLFGVFNSEPNIWAKIGRILILYCILVSIKNIVILSKEITQKIEEKRKD